MKRVTSDRLIQRKRQGGCAEAIVCLTAYDFTFARLAEEAGVEVIIVGDSLGMVLHGEQSTLKVTLDHIIYHCGLVRRGIRGSLLVADMPFGCCADVAGAVDTAIELVRQGEADMVKLEGGEEAQLKAVRSISALGIPVCAHLGTLPQQALRSGYRAFPAEQADVLFRQAAELEQAGATMLVLECVPAALAAKVTEALSIPVIGIGSGPHCDGQVLVLYDAIGISVKPPPFSRDFTADGKGIKEAIADYANQVRSRRWP